ncbi:MAG: DEAD/DEAH box helicase, partial [Parcubacteria group bacterium]|nr:DEAD/DEAH box helicase [Parcubacteria group bacterium]
MKTAHIRRGRTSSSRGTATRTSSRPAHTSGTYKKSRSSGSRFGGGKRSGASRSSSYGNRPRGGGKKRASFDPSRFINTNPREAVVEEYTPTHAFTDFGINARIIRILSASDISIPSPIQDMAIPHILAGRDVVGLAETGTGKTAAFLLPLIHATLADSTHRTLILAPTRELALQIKEELHTLSRGLSMKSALCVGGMNIRPQIQALHRPQQFIIGTPGRVLDLIKRKDFNPASVRAVVLDEADRMLDMGFIHDIRTILSHTTKDRRTLFFSATMPKEAEKLVGDFLIDPVRVSVKKKDVTDSIKQDVIPYAHHEKFDTLLALLGTQECSRVIVFGAMKHSVEKLAKELTRSGVKAESIHGNKSHGQRQRALNAFKSGTAHVLVATDVAARGIHVDDVSHVINYDLPTTFEDYVHRIGRTGRGDKRGIALT